MSVDHIFLRVEALWSRVQHTESHRLLLAPAGMDMTPSSLRSGVLQCVKGWAWGIEKAIDHTPDLELSCRGIADRFVGGRFT